MRRHKWLALVLAATMLLGMFPAIASAGSSEADATRSTLLAGQHLPVGEVLVWNDAENIYVKYVITDSDWCLTETHLHVGQTFDSFPLAVKNNNPAPGQFDFGMEHDPCVTEYTYEVSIGDLTGNVQIAAHAVVSNAPKGQAGVVYGSRTTGGTKGLYEIDVVSGTATLMKEITGGAADVNNGTGYTNGLAYDPANNTLYFTAPSAVNVVPSPLWSYNVGTGVLAPADPVSLEGSVVGASFHNGEYYYMAEMTNTLKKINLGGGGMPVEVFTGFSTPTFTFGDFAISNDGMLYGSTRVSPLKFFSLDLNSTETEGGYYEYPGATALDLQLAYGSNGVLYGTKHATGRWYTVDVTTGMQTLLPFTHVGFADLASGELFTEKTETAWAEGSRFTAKGNWATYFGYMIEQAVEQGYGLHIATVNGSTGYWHEYDITYTPSTNTAAGTGTYSGGTETLSEFTVVFSDGRIQQIAFRATYGGYSWYPSFWLNNDYTLTFVDGYGGDNVDSATGTWNMVP